MLTGIADCLITSQGVVELLLYLIQEIIDNIVMVTFRIVC